MNRKLVDKWLSALRSDRYEQAQGYLKTSGEDDESQSAYCCLGVLCDLYPAGHFEQSEHGAYTHTFRYRNTKNDTMPPEYIVHATGLTMSQAHTLAGLNDRHETFKRIAEVIEDMLDGKYEEEN